VTNLDGERFEEFLRANGLKATSTRRLIFREIMASTSVHLDAEEILRRLRRKGKTASLATIYRTLSLLVKSGLVGRVDLGENHAHYEREGPRAGHGHLICLSCGRVIEFADASVQGALAQIGVEHSFRLDKFSLQIFGYCADCRT
jgi:Fur family transcriptional regulator, ferric uptake regulator